jgi:hypothetical protein
MAYRNYPYGSPVGSYYIPRRIKGQKWSTCPLHGIDGDGYDEFDHAIPCNGKCIDEHGNPTDRREILKEEVERLETSVVGLESALSKPRVVWADESYYEWMCDLEKNLPIYKVQLERYKKELAEEEARIAELEKK